MHPDPATLSEFRAGISLPRLGFRREPQTRSMIVAVAIPWPMHIVCRPRRAPLR